MIDVRDGGAKGNAHEPDDVHQHDAERQVDRALDDAEDGDDPVLAEPIEHAGDGVVGKADDVAQPTARS